jgi:hypothetical protein
MQANGTAARAAVRTQSAPITPAPSRMTLTAIRRGPQANPRRFLVYGVEGVGKSSFAAGAPNAIFLCPEDGTDELDIARFPEPRSWQEVLDALNSLLAGDHDFKTLVVDTVDWIEPLLFAHVCKLAGKQSITDFGYGDGYRASLDLWRVFTSRCDELRHKRGMQIVLLGHSQVKEFRDPSNDAYERYQLKLYKDSSGWLREWSDAVLFANYDVATKENKRGRVRAFDSGTRFLYTVRSPAYDAKNRLNLPPRVPLSWDALGEAIEANAPASPAKLRRDLDELAKLLEPAHAQKLAAAVARVGDDAVKLAHLVDWASARVVLAQDDAETAPQNETDPNQKEA